MTDRLGTIDEEVWIDAPPEVVFEDFTDLDLWKRWQAVDGAVDARPGGGFRLLIAGAAVASGEFVVVDPPHRLVMTWGWEGSDLLPPGSATVEIELVAERRGTRLRLSHRDLPRGEVESMIEGWAHYLERLRVAGAGADPGPDPWVEEQSRPDAKPEMGSEKGRSHG